MPPCYTIKPPPGFQAVAVQNYPLGAIPISCYFCEKPPKKTKKTPQRNVCVCWGTLGAKHGEKLTFSQC